MDISKLREERLRLAYDPKTSEKKRSDLLYWYVTANEEEFSNIRIPYVKESDIVVGAKFWFDNSSILDPCDIRLMTITYVRSGVAFYTDNKCDEEKNFFTSGTLFSERIIEYFEYETDYDPKLFKFVSIYGHTIIKYKNK